jgi:hypothetical protein
MLIETGLGDPNATSYASTADADAYLAARGLDAAWVDLTPTEKEQLLQRACDYMAQSYRSNWRGYRANSQQALDWPRQGVQLFDLPTAAQIPYDVIPVEVKNAQIELAVRAIDGPLLSDLSRGVLAESVGAVSVTYDRTSPQQTRFIGVDAMLAHLFRSHGVMVQLGRC